MNCRLVHWFARVALLFAFPGFLFDVFAEDLVPTNEAIKAAVTKSLPLLERPGSRNASRNAPRRFGSGR